MGPAGWAISLVIGVFSAKLEEIDLTRQPVRIYPLMLNGHPYIGGVGGFKENSYFESIKHELGGTIDAVSDLTKLMISSGNRI
jgi:hypothetical protein